LIFLQVNDKELWPEIASGLGFPSLNNQAAPEYANHVKSVYNEFLADFERQVGPAGRGRGAKRGSTSPGDDVRIFMTCCPNFLPTDKFDFYFIFYLFLRRFSG